MTIKELMEQVDTDMFFWGAKPEQRRKKVCELAEKLSKTHEEN